MCDRARDASTHIELASELSSHNIEHPSNYAPAKLMEVVGNVNWVVKP